MAFKPFTKKGPKEKSEPKREEKREAKMPPFARKKVESKEKASAFPNFKAGGKVKKGC